jgi:hypothetical protein
MDCASVGLSFAVAVAATIAASARLIPSTVDVSGSSISIG